jgi:hypothetical protein
MTELEVAGVITVIMLVGCVWITYKVIRFVFGLFKIVSDKEKVIDSKKE